MRLITPDTSLVLEGRMVNRFAGFRLVEEHEGTSVADAYWRNPLANFPSELVD